MDRQRNIFSLHSQLPIYGSRLFRSLRGACIDSADFVQRLKLEKSLDVHQGCVNTICWDETGSVILSGSDDKKLCVTDPFTSTVVTRSSSGHRSNIFSAQFLPCTQNNQIVSCSGDGQISYTIVDREDTHGTNMFLCHYGTTYEVVTVPGDPNTFLSCGEDGSVRWFDLRTKTSCSKDHCKSDILINCRRAVTTLTVNPMQPYHLAVGCSDSTVRIFDRRVLGTRAQGSSYSGRGIHAMFCYLCPSHIKKKYSRPTSLNYDRDGEELLVSYSTDYIYCFNLKEDEEMEFKCAIKEEEPKKTPDEADTVNPVKRLRLRGDWSDTGPKARPRSERAGEDDPPPRISIVQRMSEMLSRWLEDTPQHTRRVQDETRLQASPERPEGQQQQDETSPESQGSRSSADAPSPQASGAIGESSAGEVVNRSPSKESRWSRENVKSGQMDVKGRSSNDEQSVEVKSNNESKTKPSTSPSNNSVTRPTVCPSSNERTVEATAGPGSERVGGFTEKKRKNRDKEHGIGAAELGGQSGEGGDVFSEKKKSRKYSSDGKEGERFGGDREDEQLVSRGEHVPETEGCKGNENKRTAGSRAGIGDDDRSGEINSQKHGDGREVLIDTDSRKPSKDKMKSDRTIAGRDNGPGTPGVGEDNRAGRPGDVGGDGGTEEEGKVRNDSKGKVEREETCLPLKERQEDWNPKDRSTKQFAEQTSRRRQRKVSVSGVPGQAPVGVQVPAGAQAPAGAQVTLGDQVTTGAQVPASVPSSSEQTPPTIIQPTRSQLRAEETVSNLRSRFETGNVRPAARPRSRRVSPSRRLPHFRREILVNTDEMDLSDSDSDFDSDDDLVLRRPRMSSSSTDESRDQEATRTEGVAASKSSRLKEFFKNHRARKEKEEEDLLRNMKSPKLKMVFKGHRNSRTMIKEASFWGNNHVLSGSDCGHIFIWNRHTGKLVMLLEGDRHVVNCIQPHPTDPILATSGIDYDIKIWTPLAEKPLIPSGAEEVIRINELMLEETRDTITIPPSFMLRMLASLNHLRTDSRATGEAPDSDSSDD